MTVSSQDDTRHIANIIIIKSDYDENINDTQGNFERGLAQGSHVKSSSS